MVDRSLPVTPGAKNLRIALDVSPLFQTTTSGTATYLIELMRHLPLVAPQDDFIWFYSAPWRSGRRQPPAAAVAGSRMRAPIVPPRVLQVAWHRLHWPTVRLLAGNPDVYHGSHLWRPPLGRARGVVTVHDLTTVLRPEDHLAGNVELYRQLLTFARQTAAGVLVDSEATRQDLLSLAPELEPRTRVVYLAPSSFFRPVEDRNELKRHLAPLGLTGGPYFLYTGALEPRKNVPRLVEAFRDVVQAEGQDLTLVISGPSGWGDYTVSADAERLGIAGHVDVTGAVPREMLRFLMAGAVALVYPSLYEGFGIPPLEAMACGTPVITSNLSSLPEVVGDAAVLVDPRRVDEIADAMRRVLRDAALRETLRARGYRRVREFSWEKTAAETADFYQWVAETG